MHCPTERSAHGPELMDYYRYIGAQVRPPVKDSSKVCSETVSQ